MDGKEEMKAFQEAVRRGVKRLQYRPRTSEVSETDELETGGGETSPGDKEKAGEDVGLVVVEREDKEPPAKRMKEQGCLGEGWDRASPDRCKEGKVLNVGQVKEGRTSPKCFSEVNLVQRKILD